MGPAVTGVILDSSIAIEAERQRLDVARFLKLIAERIGEREAALSAISVAELAHGVYRAVTAERRRSRRAFLDDLKAAVPSTRLRPKQRNSWANCMLKLLHEELLSLSTIC